MKKCFEVPDSFKCNWLEWRESEIPGVYEWVISWINPNKVDEYGGEIRITFTEKGQVIQYFTNYYDLEEEGKPVLTEKQAYEKALKYLKEKGGYDLISLKYIEREQSQPGYMFFYFEYYKEGIPVYDEELIVFHRIIMIRWY